LDEQRFVAPARFASIADIEEFVLRAARLAGLDEEALFHVELAVDEACTNIVEHAYGGEGNDQIEVACGTRVVEGTGYFIVRLRDQGKPFDPDVILPPRPTSNVEALQVGGLGIHFMRKSMDRIEFQFGEGGNELVMYKRLIR